MCDEGRFGWKYLHSDQRILLPEQRSGGKVVSRDWDVVLPAARAALVEAAKRGEGAIGAVLSPWMTLEEAYLLASYLNIRDLFGYDKLILPVKALDALVANLG